MLNLNDAQKMGSVQQLLTAIGAVLVASGTLTGEQVGPLVQGFMDVVGGGSVIFSFVLMLIHHTQLNTVSRAAAIVTIPIPEQTKVGIDVPILPTPKPDATT